MIFQEKNQHHLSSLFSRPHETSQNAERQHVENCGQNVERVFRHFHSFHGMQDIGFGSRNTEKKPVILTQGHVSVF